jgi:hypothetical protein
LPDKTPVIVVERVIAGVVVGFATVPARPLADTTETEVTVPAPVALTGFKVRAPLASLTGTYPATGLDRLIVARFEFVNPVPPFLGISGSVPISDIFSPNN